MLYGSWYTVLAIVVGVILGLLGLIKVWSFYLRLYSFYKEKNETKASMYKTMMQNFAMEILFFIVIVVFIVVAVTSMSRY